MAKTIEQWLLFKYIGGQIAPLSKPFKTKLQQALKRKASGAANSAVSISSGGVLGQNPFQGFVEIAKDAKSFFSLGFAKHLKRSG